MLTKGFAALFGVVAILSLIACGGDGDSLEAGNGQALVSITDDAGDFLSYTVKVSSLTLVKQNGTVVSTLPVAAAVDFAQLADLSEFLTAATVPSGTYVGIRMNLDYGNADVEVDDGTGAPVKAGTIRDRGGNPITTLTVTLQLDGNHPLVIVPGIPALLQLDFNLAASNAVDMTNPAAPAITVDPVLSASLSLDDTKPHHLRGPLTSVNTGTSAFTIGLRPFHLLTGNFGAVTVYTNDSTAFEIDQTAYTGAAGLTQLAGESALTAIAAVVTLDTATGHLVATEVDAGSSVLFGTSDYVRGNVVARSGNLLTVRGATLVRTDSSLTFHDTVTVSVGAGTKVVRQRSATAAQTGDISVGQRIDAFGVWDNTTGTLDVTDAAKGVVRMLVTQLNGNAVGVSGQTLTMDLDFINGRPIGLFDFAGTGSPDADPNSYGINVASGIDVSGIGGGTPLRVRGFVAPFGSATATDDFDASTVINVSQGPADLLVGWPLVNQITAPFSSYTAGGMIVDLSASGLVHEVIRSGIVTPLSITDTPTVNAQHPAAGLFIISYHGVIQMYTTLASYQSALQSRVSSGQVARAFAAHGTYDDLSKTLSASAMYVLLE